jgi:hypothetical protein
MKTKTYKLSILIVAAVGAVLAVGLIGLALIGQLNTPYGSFTSLLADNSAGPVRLAQTDVSGKFDRMSCELNCRSSYRYDWSSDSPLYYGCLQKCTDQARNNFFGNKKKDELGVH